MADQDFFGPTGPASGHSDFFGPVPQPQHAQSAPGLDGYFESAPVGRVLDAFGQGAKDGWGDSRLGLSLETDAYLAKAGIFNDYTAQRTNFVKSFNEALIRPAAAGLDVLMRAPPALFQSAATGLRQISRETAPKKGSDEISTIAGAASELIGAVPQGFLPEGTIPHGEVSIPLARARNLGIVGEGEGGYFGTKEPPPEDLAARAAAAREQIIAATAMPPVAGRPAEGVPGTHVAQTEPVAAPAPDIHAVAREIAPDSFRQYDALKTRQATFRRWIDELAETRAQSPKVADLQGQINTILGKVAGAEDRLTKSAADRLQAARDDLDTFLHTDTADMAQVRQALQKNDFVMRDLAPDVAAAYRQAAERTGFGGEIGEQPADVSRETLSREGLRTTLGAIATEHAAEVSRIEAEGTRAAAENPAPKKPVSIASDISQKLVSAGRPLEEADAAAAIVQAHYEARAARLGTTADELYGKEAPGIETAEKGRKGEFGRTVVKDGRATIRLMKTADASTFMHETGHQWLEELMRDASDERATANVKSDAQTVREWLGTKEGEDIPTRAHEKFARGFERYLMEGTAPTRALARVFAKFKDWLTTIYQNVAKLRAPINDDIRAVFDRLIAAKPEKPIIAPEREPEQTMADIHETDAETTPPEHAGAIADTVRAEINDLAREKAPDAHAAALAAEEQAHGVPGADAGVPSGGDVPESITGRIGDAPEPGTLPKGGNEAEAEGPIVRGKPGERGRPAVRGSGEPVTEPNARLTRADESGRIDKAGNIRLDTLNSTEDVNATLREWADRNAGFLNARRGVVTEQEIMDYADSQGLAHSDVNIDKLRAMSVDDGIPLAARILGARQMLVQSAQAVHLVMQGEDELAYIEAAQRHLKIQEAVAGITAEWGRAGHAFRKIGEEASKAQELSQFLEMSTGKTLFQIKREMAAGARLDSPTKVSGFLRGAAKPSGGEMLLEIFKNWLISGPITHTTYAIGNFTLALYKAVPETMARAAVGAAHEVIAGKPIERVRFGEIPAQLYALFYGQRRGFQAAWDSLKAGQTMALPGEGTIADLAIARATREGLSSVEFDKRVEDLKANPTKAMIEAAANPTTQFTKTKAVPGIAGAIVRAPGERMVAPLHSYFRSVSYEMNKAALVYRKAVSEGLSGRALHARVADLSVHTPEDIMAAARGEATGQTLMGQPGKFTQNLSRWINTEIELPGLGRTRPLAFIDPFLNIASNINKQAFLDRGPLGLVSKAVRDDLRGKNGKMAQDTAIAKIGLGTSLALVGGGLAMQGIINPSAPADRNQAAMTRMTNGIPHSVRIGEHAYQLNRLGVIGMQLSVAADLYYFADALEKDDLAKAGSLLVHSFAQNFLDEGFMSGVSDLLKALDDSDRYGEQYLRNFVSSIAVPFSVGMSQVARQVDPYERLVGHHAGEGDGFARQARSMLDALIQKIPNVGFESLPSSEWLKPRRDIWGEPIPNEAFRGVYVQHVENDPVNHALMALGYFPAPVQRKIRGVELTDDQFDRYSMVAGRSAKMQLSALIAMPGWTSVPQEMRVEMIKKVIEGARDSARTVVIMESVGTDNDIMRQAAKNKTAPLRGALGAQQ